MPRTYFLYTSLYCLIGHESRAEFMVWSSPPPQVWSGAGIGNKLIWAWNLVYAHCVPGRWRHVTHSPAAECALPLATEISHGLRGWRFAERDTTEAPLLCYYLGSIMFLHFSKIFKLDL